MPDKLPTKDNDVIVLTKPNVFASTGIANMTDIKKKIKNLSIIDVKPEL